MPRHDAALRDACEREDVGMPLRLSGEETVQEAVQDYALRTFTSHDAPEPRPPPGVAVLCCNRVAAVRRPGSVDFVRLPDREMQWAPLPVRHDAGIAGWVPAWVCPDVPVPAQAGELCGGCGNQLRWEYDLSTERGRFHCSAGCIRPAEVPLAPGPAPGPTGSAVQPAVLPAGPVAAQLPAVGYWLSRGPPAGEVWENTNSWLYVPLLQAAAGDLLPPAAEAWRADPRTHGWWEEARRLLVASEPVSPRLLAAAIRRAAEATPAYSHHIPDILERLGQAGLPAIALVHVGWAVRQLREPDGYLLAPVQEALLECYGGLRVASLDRHSDRFRPEPPTVPPVEGTEAAAVACAPHAQGRRMRRRRTHGVPRDSGPDEDGAASVSDCAASAPSHPPHSFAGTGISGDAARWLDDLDLLAEFRRRVPTLQTVPRFLVTGVRRAFVAALDAIRSAHVGRVEVKRVRAWKLFFMLPRLLLARCPQAGTEGRAVLMRRLQLLQQGNLVALHAQTPTAGPSEARSRADLGGDPARAAASAKVKRGQLSRARQLLTAAALAPGDDSTLRALTDPARRPPQLLRPLTPDVLTFSAAEEVTLTVAQVADALRSTKRGSAAGLSGATIELYKLLLDDAAALESLTFAVNILARAQAPPIAQDAIALSRLTALRKPGGGVRGIATGDVFRRLVSRALARAYATTCDEATRPFQFALQTRAGTDRLAAMLRAAVELNPETTVISQRV